MVPSPTVNNLESVSCTGSDCWVVGSGGTIIRVPQTPDLSTSNNDGTITQGTPESNTVTDVAGTVTVKLLDSLGNGLSGGLVQYFNGSWHTFGTTGTGGAVSSMLLPDNYDFRMTYAYGQVEKWQNVRANPTVVFQTLNVAVELKDGFGNRVGGGVVRYYSDSWHDIGTTDSSGAVKIELLATTYNFSMDCNLGHSEKSQNIGWSANVIFFTSMFT